ncbi:sulfotransferase family 2 domain-containing protein [Neptuniibacter sp. QD72_48]|uniref:sulfotransferase family 2 domain-containing protein n=1 Tax=Neptuniibacter sp. QD72_48 TaxID=3398214 RepID=UPI0039F55F97
MDKIENLLKNLFDANSRHYIRKDIVKRLPSCLLEVMDSEFKFLYPDYYRDGKVVFIHVPKAAGTSIAETLYGRSITHHTADHFRKANRKLYSDSFTFSVVRNPYERLVSAYKFAKAGGTKRVPIRNPELYTGKDFSNFENFVKNWLVRKDINNIDFVFQPQWIYVCDKKSKIIVDRLYDVKDLSACEIELSNQLGHDVFFPKVNSTGNEDYRDYYNDGLVKEVKEIYYKDFEVLPFSEQWERYF